ncbi:MAG: hypothetical protein H6838_19410 [Planctomycetes bacterium]|nr:hypothetical protein [Planctomycetota bacterium]
MTDETEDPRRRGERGQRATVLTRLNNGMLRLRTMTGSEVTGHAALDLRMALTRLLPGDAVMIEVSPFDPTRARILSLAKSQEPSSATPPHSSQPHPTQQRELP